MGTDLTQTTAAQFMEESFIPVDKEAKQLHLNIDKRYKVTDNLVSDMISTVETEAPDILLLGAGPRFMMEGEKSMAAFFGLFRKKVDDVMKHVSCPVAVLVNRTYRENKELAILINGEADKFLFAYTQRMLANSDRILHLYYTNQEPNEQIIQILQLNQDYPDNTVLHPFAHIEELTSTTPYGLLLLSYDTCAKIAAKEEIYKQLPSLLVIKDKVIF